MLNNSLISDIANLIVDTLNLDVPPEEIKANEPLFGAGGLGLDSIDSLELALALSNRYGIELKSDDAERFNIFENLNSLAEYIKNHTVK